MTDTRDHRAKEGWVRDLSSKPLVAIRKTLIWGAGVVGGFALLFVIVSWLWPSSGGTDDIAGGGKMYYPTRVVERSKNCPGEPEVVELEGKVEVTINPGGRCLIQWAFDGLVDIIDSRGRVRTVKGTDYIREFWTEKVRSSTGGLVVMNYKLTD